MPSIEISKLQAVTAPRALSDTDRSLPTPQGAPPSQAGSTKASGVSLEVSASVDTAEPLVDSYRVAEIKNALQEGRYPLVPAEIADAIIAAQVSFGLER